MCKALLVDDEDAVLDIMAKLLEMNGFSVLTASSAADGAAKLAAGPVDVVITDLRMESPLAGYDVVKAARELSPRPLIVLLTAFPVPAAEWRRAGVDTLLVKGTNPVAFSRQLKEMLKTRS